MRSAQTQTSVSLGMQKFELVALSDAGGTNSYQFPNAFAGQSPLLSDFDYP